jgi:gamma-glutamyltranspeptidase/glutathione hydrolase
VRLLCKDIYQPLREGDLFFNKDLARTLELIARDGLGAFYRGKIAQALVEDMEKNGGLITMEDLASYEARVYKPAVSTYREYDVHLVPYAHGGMTVGQTLNILEQFDPTELEHETVKYYHILAEAEKRAFTDRLCFYGDPYFEAVPWEGIL